MEIIYNLDDKNDSMDVLGHLFISSPFSLEKIEVENAYIDEWLSGLLEGFLQLKENDYVEVDLLTEARKLIFCKLDQKISLSFSNTILYFQSLDECLNTLTKSIKKLTFGFDNLQIQHNILLKDLHKSINEGHTRTQNIS
jgi:hypothetical protein